MIKSVKVTNHNRESLTLELYHPEKCGIIIDNIEGLGPPQADINSTETATVDGGIFTSARMQQRNIVFTLSPMFDPLIEDSRLRIYKYFPIKKPIHLEFTTDYRHAECDGYVESNTPDIFSAHETVQVSIICPDPYFYELGQEEIAFAGVHPMFEFPFSNEWERTVISMPQPGGDTTTIDILYKNNTLEFGDIRDDNRAIIDYIGDVDTGVLITIHVMSGTAENVTIWNVDTRERIKIDTNKIKRLTNISFSQGDDIIINTKIGSKSIQLLHDGKYYNIISCINKDADWFQLTSGHNTFTFVADYGDNNLMVTFNYRNAYGGI